MLDYYAFKMFSFLIRHAINAETVIPVITLLIPWPIIAVTAAGGDYSNTQPARLPSVTQQNVWQFP